MGCRFLDGRCRRGAREVNTRKLMLVHKVRRDRRLASAYALRLSVAADDASVIPSLPPHRPMSMLSVW
jgi:hypothetical protein